MKAVFVADIHGSLKPLIGLAKTLTVMDDLEYVILLGDFSRDFNDPGRNRQDIMDVFNILRGFNVLAIPGNCDQRESVEYFREKGAGLHNCVVSDGRVDIVGLGGGNPTPFNTPFEFSEADIERYLLNLYSHVKDAEKSVMAVHTPPYDTQCDMIGDGSHVGSKAVRAVIERVQPGLVVCSHIHESGGRKDRIGRTDVYNVGRLSDGLALKVDLNDFKADYLSGEDI
jgi:uncharacterized protein